MKKHMTGKICAALALAAALAVAATVTALADMPADEGIYQAKARAEEQNQGPMAKLWKMELFSTVLTKDANLYQDNSVGAEVIAQLKKGDSVLAWSDGIGDGHVSVLYENAPYSLEVAALTPKGEEYAYYTAISEAALQGFGRAKADLPVYTKADKKSRKLGRVPKGANVVVLGQSGSYYQVTYGDKTGYVYGTSSTFTKVNGERWADKLEKDSGVYVQPVAWDYEGLLQDTDRKLESTGFVFERSHILRNGERIAEYFYPDTSQASQAIKGLTSRNELEFQSSYDEIYINAYEKGKNTHFYRNGNTIIEYAGEDEETLQALESTHGAPFHIIP